MSEITRADMKQLLDGMESRLTVNFEGIIDALALEMRDGFAGVGEAIEQIHEMLGEHECRLGRHEVSLKRLDPEFSGKLTK